MFQGAKSPGSESSRERKFQGAKVPHLELSLPGANGLGSEKSIIRGHSHCVTSIQRLPKSTV